MHQDMVRTLKGYAFSTGGYGTEQRVFTLNTSLEHVQPHIHCHIPFTMEMQNQTFIICKFYIQNQSNMQCPGPKLVIHVVGYDIMET